MNHVNHVLRYIYNLSNNESLYRPLQLQEAFESYFFLDVGSQISSFAITIPEEPRRIEVGAVSEVFESSGVLYGIDEEMGEANEAVESSTVLHDIEEEMRDANEVFESSTVLHDIEEEMGDASSPVLYEPEVGETGAADELFEHPPELQAAA
jgi:hypothetical protein